jgi:hypothetical protein
MVLENQPKYVTVAAIGKIRCAAYPSCHAQSLCRRNVELIVAEASVPNTSPDVAQAKADTGEQLRDWVSGEPEPECVREDNVRSGLPVAVNRQYGAVTKL